MVQLLEIEKYAKENNVPIMEKDSILYIQNYIKEKNIKKILEIGTAIGYSAINFANVDNDIYVTSIERDETRYLKAIENVNKCNLSNRINLLYADALNVQIADEFDLIIFDAAKAQNINFLNKFEKNLNENGTIITDNINFHGLVKNVDEIKSRNLRMMVKKLKKYILFLNENLEYTTIYINVGDTLAVTRKKR